MDIGTIVAGLLTLAILTFLYRDNPIYKMAESLLIGIAIGYILVITWTNSLMSLLFRPLLNEGAVWLLIPLALGLMMFGRLHRRTALLSRIPIGVLIGSGAGVAIPAMLDARTLRQLSATVGPVITTGGVPDVSMLVVLIGVISTLIYFYFSREHVGWWGRTARLGTWFLMVFFGTTFGYTVMSRMSTFIGRMEFVLSDFLRVIN
ncbi:MAG: hypothetical protein RBT76_04015 [candidate division Zixibacteria bacterium]|jgi:hypothetical protein|nr:hypothetical protein [candidate division Zixibacteria bacterium]